MTRIPLPHLVVCFKAGTTFGQANALLAPMGYRLSVSPRGKLIGVPL